VSIHFPAHGGQLRRLSEHFGIPTAQLLDFSANINPEGPPPAVLAVLRSSLDDLSILTDYPDLEQTDLKRSIAHYACVTPDHLTVSNGFVPLLEGVLRTLPIRRCLLPGPAFNEYRKALTRAQVAIVPQALTPETSFAYDADALLTGNHDAILLANPQNPSGVLNSLDTILQLVARAAERKIYILLDEAFIDYLPEQSASTFTDRFPNLIVFRSVTKFHGIPGLRVAYMIAHPEMATRIAANQPPWPITTLAALAVSAALGDEDYAVQTRSLNLQRKTHLAADLAAAGIHTYESAANFLLMRLPETQNSSIFWQRLFAEHHIVLRSCHDYEALPSGHLRTAVRTAPQNLRLTQAIAKILQA
jgi:threonine-phosphate decarboxylase